jgi:hypothetical protein
MKLLDQLKPEKRAKIVPKMDQTYPTEPDLLTKSIIKITTGVESSKEKLMNSFMKGNDPNASKKLIVDEEEEKEEPAEAGKVKGRKEILKFCQNTGEKMLSYQESKLEEFETEMKHP